MAKIVERSVVAAKREGVIKDTHSDEGAVAGASREALSQIMPKALGLNVGGKIGVARYQDHVSVAVLWVSACCTWMRWLLAWDIGPYQMPQAMAGRE